MLFAGRVGEGVEIATHLQKPRIKGDTVPVSHTFPERQRRSTPQPRVALSLPKGAPWVTKNPSDKNPNGVQLQISRQGRRGDPTVALSHRSPTFPSAIGTTIVEPGTPVPGPLAQSSISSCPSGAAMQRRRAGSVSRRGVSSGLAFLMIARPRHEFQPHENPCPVLRLLRLCVRPTSDKSSGQDAKAAKKQ